MEVDVTPLFSDKLDGYLISNSVHNLGSRAAEITWSQAVGAARTYPLVTAENQSEVRNHFRGYGAWTADEINRWTLLDLSALLWQDAAADFNENWANLDWSDFEDISVEELIGREPEGTRIGYGEGRFWFYVGE